MSSFTNSQFQENTVKKDRCSSRQRFNSPARFSPQPFQEKTETFIYTTATLRVTENTSRKKDCVTMGTEKHNCLKMLQLCGKRYKKSPQQRQLMAQHENCCTVSLQMDVSLKTLRCERRLVWPECDKTPHEDQLPSARFHRQTERNQENSLAFLQDGEKLLDSI